MLLRKKFLFVDVLTQTAKKAPIIRLRRNSIKQDIDKELRIEEPPRRSQSVGNFVRQETDKNIEMNENDASVLIGTIYDLLFK